MYDLIRKSKTDIFKIAENLGYRQVDIENLKNHLFYSNHYFDRYAQEPPEIARFTASIEQALAWKRFESGTHQQIDITWMNHEFTERRYELANNAPYSESHDFSQTFFEGFPWDKANNPWDYSCPDSKL
jgi:hypothetical protein